MSKITALTLLILTVSSFSARAEQPGADAIPHTPDSPVADPAPPVILVEGQVTDSLGGGHAGVSVQVYKKGDGEELGELIGQTQTEKFGDFVLHVGKAMEGEVVVLFRAEGYADLRRSVRVGVDEYPPFLAETLSGKHLVIGRVVDVANEPVAGAAVRLTAAYSDWNDETDDDGAFTMNGVLPGSGELTVEAKGFGRERVTVARLEEFGEIVVTIKPERVLCLKVVNEDGKPVPQVVVDAYDKPRDDFRSAVTNDEGDVTLDGWHFDATFIEFRLTHEDYVSSEHFDREIVTPENQLRSEHEFVMRSAGSIVGSITDARTGEPVNGARVLVGTLDDETRPRDWTDYRGQFEVRGVAPGRVVVTLHAAGYAPDLQVVTVNAAEASKLDLALSSGQTLTGFVRTDTGDPATGVIVETGSWREYRTLDLRAQVDSEGRFTVSDVPNDEFEINLIAPRRRDVILSKTTRGADGQKIAWTVPADAIGPNGGGLALGASAPVIQVKTTDGTSIDLKKLRGKTVVLDYWATWCGPCVAELPHLMALHDKFSKRDDFAMIGISLDGDEKAFLAFVAEKKIQWPQVFGDEGGAQKAADRFGVEALPAVFVIDPEGRILGRDWNGETLVKKVGQVLEDNDPT